jgi:thiosulfate/3-mercaptopyruvate sulfurtransferase
MPYTHLISAEQLLALRASDRPCMVFDCSFDLAQPSAGHAAFVQAHIPGAVYAHLDEDLSAPHGAPGADGSVITAHAADRPMSGGRHPLPTRERFAVWLSSVGFSNAMQAVVYDRNASAYCGRLWWMLKWMGHDAVAVLDGGLAAWQAAGGPVASGEEPAHFQANFLLGAPLRTLRTASEVAAAVGQPGQTLIDARAAERYRGEVEPLDPVAGHIPGALNRPFSNNFQLDGRFKSAEQLRSEFARLLAERPPESVVHHCGSGVTANPNLLAMELAGYAPTALFAGSWSEWCSDPARPVERG